MKLAFSEKILFTKNLGVMLKAGIPLLECLETMADQGGSGDFRKMVMGLIKEIKNGKSLGEAMSKNKGIFDSYFVSLVKMGDDSGQLERNLSFLGEKLDKDLEMKRKVEGVMLYPMIVLVATVVVGVVMSIFILPQLASLFDSLEVKLPLSTKILMFVAGLTRRYNILILILMVGVVVLFKIFVALPKIKPGWHKLLLSVPLVGRFLIDVEMANFCRSLGIMLNSGMPIVAALKILDENTANLVFRGYIHRLAIAIEKGRSLEDELGRLGKHVFPGLAVKMIGAGEKSGNLSEMLMYLGDYFQDETVVVMRNFSTTLEPLLLLVVGLVVLFMAMAIITPIYDLTGSIGR